MGGDTDTNCCIVGGLLATIQPVPQDMKDKLLKFDCSKVEGVGGGCVDG